MLALAPHSLIQRLSPSCNITGSFIQSCHSYTATDIRKNIDWLANYEKTDINWRVLGRTEGSQERTCLSRKWPGGVRLPQDYTMELTPLVLLGLQIAACRCWDFSASITMKLPTQRQKTIPLPR
uniref:Uncharacterized protein n=1 Tax=Rousettus aegyptiacus TaxID=9407 RepID=A0A7J8C2H3_ROUAE|nr:hypothetical protein HJG63_009349 [Rousettus aegyptiacus]